MGRRSERGLEGPSSDGAAERCTASATDDREAVLGPPRNSSQSEPSERTGPEHERRASAPGGSMEVLEYRAGRSGQASTRPAPDLGLEEQNAVAEVTERTP